MSNGLSKCGKRFFTSRQCKPKDFPSCDSLGKAELQELIMRKGELDVPAQGEQASKFKSPRFRNVRDMDWSKFADYDGVCNAKGWYLFKAQAEEGQAAGADESGGKKGFIDEILDPIDKGIELLMKGKVEKGLSRIGWERLTGLAVGGVLGLFILVQMFRLPIKGAKKRAAVRRAEERARAEAERRERQERARFLEIQTQKARVEDLVRGIDNIKARLAQNPQSHDRCVEEISRTTEELLDIAERALDKDVARMARTAMTRSMDAFREVERAAILAFEKNRTPTPTPVPQELQEIPLELSQPAASAQEPPPVNLGVGNEKTPAQGTAIKELAGLDVEDVVIDRLLELDPLGERAEGKEGLSFIRETEQALEVEINLPEVKRAALIVNAYRLSDKGFGESLRSLILTAAGLCDRDATMGEEQLRRAVKYLSKNSIKDAQITEALAGYETWINSPAIMTANYEYRQNLKAQRMSMSGVMATKAKPEEPERLAEPIKPVRPSRPPRPAPPKSATTVVVDAVDADPMSRVGTELSGLPTNTGQSFSATQSVDHERLAVEQARRGSVFIQDPSETQFSDQDIADMEERGIEWGQPSGIEGQRGNGNYFDPARVMSAATPVVEADPRLAAQSSSFRRGISDAYTKAVMDVPGFADMYYRNRNVSAEGVGLVADLMIFMAGEESYSMLTDADRDAHVRRYLTAFAASEQMQQMHFERGVDLVTMARAGEIVESGERPSKGGRRDERRDERRKAERSGRRDDPFADSEMRGLMKDVGKKYGK